MTVVMKEELQDVHSIVGAKFLWILWFGLLFYYKHFRVSDVENCVD